MPRNWSDLKKDCFDEKDDPWRQTLFVGPNRLLTITSYDDVFFTHIEEGPESIEKDPRKRVNITEKLPPSTYNRSWFSILRDE
tara:strand:+ start:109 stop:357 length:249 start_codon:yes stop_codon:yes gene_type:complete